MAWSIFSLWDIDREIFRIHREGYIEELWNMQVLADLRFGLTCSKLFNCWINNASTLESLQKDQALAKNATRFVFWNFLYILLSCSWKAQSCFAASDEDEHIVCWSISSCITHCNCSTQFYQQRAWEQRVDKSGVWLNCVEETVIQDWIRLNLYVQT